MVSESQASLRFSQDTAGGMRNVRYDIASPSKEQQDQIIQGIRK